MVAATKEARRLVAWGIPGLAASALAFGLGIGDEFAGGFG